MMPSALRTRTLLPMALGAALLLPATGRAQVWAEDEGPVFGKTERLPTFQLTLPHGSLDLRATWANDSIESTGAGKSESRDTLFEETLTLQTRGYVVHPNLVSLNLGGTFGLQQESFEVTNPTGITTSQDTTGTIYAWDVSANILQNSGAPLTLYTRRSVNLLDRSFGPTLQTTDTTYGAVLSLQSRYAPTTLQLYHTDQEQAALGGQVDYTLSETVFEWLTQARLSVNQLLSWSYHYRSAEQAVQGGAPASTEDQEAVLTHSVDFGRDKRSNLNSEVDYTQQTGQFDLEILRWDERLRLWHNRNFQTDYNYTLNQQSFGGLDQTSHRANAGFRHQLYESLFTDGRVGYTRVDLSPDGGGSQTWDVSLATNYRKKVPYGTLFAGIGGQHSNQENDASSATLLVRDQQVTFSGSAPLILRSPTIRPESIVITDVAGRIFSPLSDYRVLPLGNAVQIEPIIGGALPLGAPVLLDYDLGPQGASTIVTDSFNLTGRYQIEQGWLSGVAVYARYFQQDQTVDPVAATIGNDITDVIYGVEYRVGGALLSAEREIYDSTIAPFEATRLRGTFSRRVAYDTVVGATAEYTTIDYTDTADHTEYWLLSGNVEHHLSRELSVVAAAAWRQTDSDLGGSSTGTEQSLEVRWQRRQVTIFGRVRNVDLDTDDSDSSFQLFQVGLRREF